MISQKIIFLRDYVVSKKWYILSFLAVFLILLSVRLQIDHFSTGDEPHYLLMDYSLVHDHDFSLRNNYTNGDSFRYYPEPLAPHVSPLTVDKGWYSIHGIGLPIFILPAYLFSETTGPMVLMVLVAAAAVFLLWKWTYILTKNKKISAFTAGALLFSYHFNGLAGYLYPDLLIACSILFSFIVLSTDLYKKRAMQVILGLVLSSLVFIHLRTLAIVVPIGLALLYLYFREYGKKIPWTFLAPSLLLAGLFFILLYRWYGVLQPSAIYPSNLGVKPSGLIHAPAVLFDSLRGTFVYNPILFLIPVGLPIWYKKNKKSFLLLLTLLPIFYITISFNEWFGGYSPNGRYIMGLLPALFPAIAFFVMYAKGIFNKALVYLLSAGTVLISVVAFAIKQPYTGYSTRSDIFINLEKYTHLPFDKPFPTYYFIDSTIIDKGGRYQAVFWMFVLVGLFVYGVFLSKKLSKKDA